MQIIYITTVFGQYMEDWHQSIRNNNNWKGKNGVFTKKSNGISFSMRFSEHLNITMYECCAESSRKNNVEQWHSFDLKLAWHLMWGKLEASPDHITLLTREYYDLLQHPGWQKSKKENCIIHRPSQFVFECNDDKSFNNISLDKPGSVQTFLRKLAASGWPLNMNHNQVC